MLLQQFIVPDEFFPVFVGANILILLSVVFILKHLCRTPPKAHDSDDDDDDDDMSEDQKDKKPIVQRDFTPEELAAFTGKDGGPIYLCVKGKVYDVSAKPQFYGPEGPYGKFAGRDCSRALAKSSLDVKDVENTDLSDLKNAEVDCLNQWEMSFQTKYDVIGKLVTEGSKGKL